MPRGGCGRSRTGRSTTTRPCAQISGPAILFEPAPTPRCSPIYGSSKARTQCEVCAACSGSRSTTRATKPCCSHAIRWASSRSTSPRSGTESCLPRRSRRCYAIPPCLARSIPTVSIGFEGGGYHDERAIARRVAQHLGTRHHEYSVPMEIADELPRVIAMLDEPCADSAAIPAHLVARAASADVTVLLSGTGGDEIFGGYQRYRLPALLRRVGWLPRPLASFGARLLTERDQNRRTALGEKFILARKLLDARARPDFMAAYLSTREPTSPMRWREALARRTSRRDASTGSLCRSRTGCEVL